MSNAMLIAHELLCAALFYASFCRAVKSSEHVFADVRLAFNCLGAVAAWGLAAPLAGFEPNVWTICLLAAIAYAQWATARHWHNGPPDQFVMPEHRTTRRRATDTQPKAAP